MLNLKMQRLIENPNFHDLQTTKYSSQEVRHLSHQPMFLDKDTEIINYEGMVEAASKTKDKLVNEEIARMINENI